MRPDERLASVAERQFAVFTLDQALRCGFTADQAAYRVRIGRWIPLHRGVYILAGAPLTANGRILAAVLAGGPGALASHLSAGAVFGFVQDDGVLDVTIPDRRRRFIAGARVHRPRTLQRADLSRVGPIPVTSPTRTILDLAAVVDPAGWEDSLDEALRRGLVRPRVLLRRIETQTFIGAPLIRSLLSERLDGHTESPLEARFLRLLRDAGLPRPRLQHEIRDGGRLIARVDFAFVEARVAVELDGYAFHAGKRRFDDGHERDQALIDAGWFPLHFTDRQLRKRPGAVISTVRRTVERRLGERRTR